MPVCDQSRSISFSVRYTLGRSSELGGLRGTVRFTMVEGMGLRADFAIGINLGVVATVRKGQNTNSLKGLSRTDRRQP
jgi:hypothetical protein